MRRLLAGACLLFCAGCSGGGQSGTPPPDPERTPQLEQQAVDNLLALYRLAVVEEDIDRLEGLLSPATPLSSASLVGEQGAVPSSTASLSERGVFRDAMADAFRRLTVMDVQIPAEEIRLASDRNEVSFLEVESVEDPLTLVQSTRLFRTAFSLAWEESEGITTVRIAGVTREGPLWEVTTPGQVQAGSLARVEVRAGNGGFVPARVEVTVPETGTLHVLSTNDAGFHGAFGPPVSREPRSLTVHVHGPDGEEVVFDHRYRLRVPGEGVVERIGDTGSTALFALAIGPDGSVWVGGDDGARLYRIAADGTTTLLGPLLADPGGRVEDLAFDALGRLHVLVFSPGQSGDIVLDQDVFCQTANVVDAAYPLRVRDLVTRGQRPSAATRVAVADGGDVWLFGSDGGVARVSDGFRDGQCPAAPSAVTYEPVLRRGANGLPSNTVPALATGMDGTVWLGTALGLVRWRDGEMTHLPFDPGLSLSGDVATLEAFFPAVAQALFDATPLSTVALGEVSFEEAFGGPLIKEDLIFSAVVDPEGRLWAGTLGGGLRRIEGTTQTLHLRRRDGLASNLIHGLAVGPEGTVWVATEQGASRVEEAQRDETVTNFSPLDGLATPVRDVAVDEEGTAWLATGGGLYRIIERGGELAGTVVDDDGEPVPGVDVLVQDTPFRMVTDADGQFVLAGLPRGTHSLALDTDLAPRGPFVLAAGTSTTVSIEAGDQSPLRVRLTVAQVSALLPVSGDSQCGPEDAPLPEPLVVQVADEAGVAVAGVPVTFTVLTGDGSVSPATVTTDDQGRAATSLVLSAPGTVTVAAAFEGGEPLVFTASAVSAATPVVVEGNNQIIGPGEELLAPLVVRWEDQLGGALAGRSLEATVVQGSATVIDPVVVTDAQGQARFTIVAGPGLENIEVVITEVTPEVLEVCPPTIFTHVPIATRLGSLSVVSGNHQVTGGGGPLEPLVVRLEGGSGAPVEGVSIAADIVTRGTATFVDTGTTEASVVTDARGEASFVVEAGANRGVPVELIAVRVSTPGVETVEFNVAVARLVGPTDVAAEGPDALVFSDASRRAVMRLNLADGALNVVSDATAGDGPLLEMPAGIAVEAGGTLVVTDAVRGAVVRVDPATGDRTVVSDGSTGSGPDFASPFGIAIAEDGTLVVADLLLGGVMRVDPATGDRTELPIVATVNGVAGNVPAMDVLLPEDGGLLVVTLPRGVARVGPLSPEAEFSLLPVVHVFGSVLEADGSLVMLTFTVSTLGIPGPGLVRVSPIDLVFALVSDAGVGSGPLFFPPGGVVVDTDGSLLVLTSDALVHVDPVTGDRTVVWAW